MSDYQEQVEYIDEKSLTQGFNSLNLQSFKNFQRPQIQLIPNQDLQLMNIDISSSIQNYQGISKPYIKIYAVNKFANSFEIIVNKFEPYFYTDLPNIKLDKDNLQRLRICINKFYQDKSFAKHTQKYNEKNFTDSQAIQYITVQNKINIRNYTPDHFMLQQQCLKIVTTTTKVISGLRKLFQQQIIIDGGIKLPKQTYQSNIPYALRFMIDKDIVGMSWFRIKYSQIKKIRNEKQKDSVCQIEIQCECSAIQPLIQYSLVPPLRILSFDIECGVQKGFPSSQQHEIIQIACVCKTSTQIQYDYKVVFVLNGAHSISGVHVKGVQNEIQLLEDFEKLIYTYDPDFIIGYNMINFDLKYILQRSIQLKKKKMKNYGHFGRSLFSISRIKTSTFKSKMMGMRQTQQINIDGRIQLDLMIHMHKQHKLTSYRLNNVAYHFLKDQKQDVHHSEIYKLHKQSYQTRKRLAIYCLKDAELPLRLMEKLCCLYNYTQMARVTGVPINYLLNRGQQIKVVSQLLRKAKQYNYIMPTMKVMTHLDQKGYEGAFVLQPQCGFYETPIATLDFASLYPSIMIAHNLCYTTLVKNDMLQNYELKEDDITHAFQGCIFVKNHKRKGLLPQILQQLIAARKKAKLQLKQTVDPMMKMVLQGRQLALKISANSVYGFTGALVGQLPCLEISSSVTSFGRMMIEHTRNKVLELYQNGTEVIYGDTDSVMVKFKLEESENQSQQQQIRQAMKYGKEAAQIITKQFIFPIKLQFEKVYCPYLLLSKKRYAGIYYTRPNQYDKIDKKGIQSVRRDNCVLIREMLENILEKILCHSDIKGTAQYIKLMVSNLVQNKIDISKLVISKAISKKTQEKGQKQSGKQAGKKTYKIKQAHTELAQKMQKRDENVNVNIGDRISYVMIVGQKGSRNYENAQDPIKVLEEDLSIDYDYYIEKQIKPPLQRLLKHTNIIGNFDALFVGQHTKIRYIPKINKNNFMSKFIKINSKCLNCSSKQQNVLCSNCQPKAIDIFLKKQQQINILKHQYQIMWRQCQDCQGMILQKILCSNLDCPIFYKRIKVQKDLKQKEKQISRFQQF